ncbi:MAG TPA: cysteine desulfurase NifS [Firmicutes bacterium]|nr:cysteine desulfurase NifS [Candidatus Fermentithermobacillaceae bacterium]
MKRIYMDNAATTSLKPEVLEAMMPYLTGKYGNASTLYLEGREAREAVEQARERTARALGAQPEEIYFTSGGTEADNWAIKGVAFARREKGNHIITSQIEHHAVLQPCEYLEKHGFHVTYLPVDSDGLVDPGDVSRAIEQNTVLVSIMFANNEIGTIEPVAEIARICREKGVLFHTDAVQAVGHVPVDVEKLGVDLLSLSAHKFHGPKGIGALYVRKGVRLDPFIHGGGQERNRRAGTENVAGIVGLGAAIELATSSLEERAARIAALRDKLIDGVLERVPDVKLNGHRIMRLPGNAHFCFRFIEGESLLLNLDVKGVSASSGSACTSGSLEPSHVLLALGLPHEMAQGSLRLTLDEENTGEEVDYVLDILPDIVKKLRPAGSG